MKEELANGTILYQDKEYELRIHKDRLGDKYGAADCDVRLHRKDTGEQVGFGYWRGGYKKPGYYNKRLTDNYVVAYVKLSWYKLPGFCFTIRAPKGGTRPALMKKMFTSFRTWLDTPSGNPSFRDYINE